jgi:hypothetical protein
MGIAGHDPEQIMLLCYTGYRLGESKTARVASRTENYKTATRKGAYGIQRVGNAIVVRQENKSRQRQVWLPQFELTIEPRGGS